MKRITVCMAIAAASAAPVGLRAQATAADSTAIVAAALDYLEGWYEGNADRMDRALHPDLAKRVVMNTADGKTELQHMGEQDLVGMTRRRGERDKVDLRDRIRILDIFGKAAVVRADADSWVDFLQIARIEGEWVIVNVLWELHPSGR